MDTDSDATVAEFSETEGHQSDDEVTSSPSLLDTAKKPLIQEQTNSSSSCAGEVVPCSSEDDDTQLSEEFPLQTSALLPAVQTSQPMETTVTCDTKQAVHVETTVCGNGRVMETTSTVYGTSQAMDATQSAANVSSTSLPEAAGNGGTSQAAVAGVTSIGTTGGDARSRQSADATVLPSRLPHTSQAVCTPSQPTRQMPLPPLPADLAVIEKEQATLLIEMDSLQVTAMANSVMDGYKARVAIVEQQLKAIGLANQEERKALAAQHHSSHSQSRLKEEESSSHTATLRESLLALASKQKRLLKCFVKQKELAARLSTLTAALLVKQAAVTPAIQVPSHVKPALANLSRPVTTPPSAAGHLALPLLLTQPALSGVRELGAQDNHVPTLNSLEKAHTLDRAQQSSKPQVPPSALPSELAQPVPLDVLIKHGFLKPGPNCFSSTVLGCAFKVSLAGDGSLQGADGAKFQLPQQWVRACWAKLGHQKRPSRKQAYNMILYNGVPLLHYCEKYSLKQVSSYLKAKKDGQLQKQDNKQTAHHTAKPMVVQPSTVLLTAQKASTTPNTEVTDQSGQQHSSGIRIRSEVTTTTSQYYCDTVLSHGRVLLLPPSCRESSLQLPDQFWEAQDGSSRDIPHAPQLLQQLACDLEW